MSSERQSRLESIENRRSEVEARLAEVHGGAEHLHTPAPDELAAEGRGGGVGVAAQLQMLDSLEREVHRLGPGGQAAAHGADYPPSNPILPNIQPSPDSGIQPSPGSGIQPSTDSDEDTFRLSPGTARATSSFARRQSPGAARQSPAHPSPGATRPPSGDPSPGGTQGRPSPGGARPSPGRPSPLTQGSGRQSPGNLGAIPGRPSSLGRQSPGLGRQSPERPSPGRPSLGRAPSGEAGKEGRPGGEEEDGGKRDVQRLGGSKGVMAIMSRNFGASFKSFTLEARREKGIKNQAKLERLLDVPTPSPSTRPGSTPGSNLNTPKSSGAQSPRSGHTAGYEEFLAAATQERASAEIEAEVEEDESDQPSPSNRDQESPYDKPGGDTRDHVERLKGPAIDGLQGQLPIHPSGGYLRNAEVAPSPLARPRPSRSPGLGSQKKDPTMPIAEDTHSTELPSPMARTHSEGFSSCHEASVAMPHNLLPLPERKLAATTSRLPVHSPFRAHPAALQPAARSTSKSSLSTSASTSPPKESSPLGHFFSSGPRKSTTDKEGRGGRRGSMMMLSPASFPTSFLKAPILPQEPIDVMSMVGGPVQRSPQQTPDASAANTSAFACDAPEFEVVCTKSGNVFTTRFYGGKLEHSLTLLEEQSTPIQLSGDTAADDDFEDAEKMMGEEMDDSTTNLFRLASVTIKKMLVSGSGPNKGLVHGGPDEENMHHDEEQLDVECVEDDDRLASYRGNKTLVLRTLSLLVVSVTDLVLAFGMHAWPDESTVFGDLTFPPADPDGHLPAFCDLLMAVIVFYWIDLFLILVSRDSSGVTVGSSFFTDPKLGLAGSRNSRLWRTLVLFLSTIVFFLLYYGGVYDLARFHALLHILRSVNAMSRLVRMGDEITQKLKVTVSQNKRRFIDRSLALDLDLTYICDRVIAMSLPCVSDAVHRNDIKEVSRFFRSLHYGCFLVVNLCQHFEERGNGNYDKSVLFNQVQKIPCVDHNAPMMHQLLAYCESATAWLNRHTDNVIAVHCKGGKGRTGTFIVGLILWVGRFNNPTEAVKYVQARRADLRLGSTYQGVSSPSQLRTIGYLMSVVYCGTCHATLASALLTKVILYNFPRSVSKGGALSLIVEADGDMLYDFGKAEGLLFEVDQHNREDVEDIDLYCNFEFLLDKPVLLDRDAVVRIYRFLPADAAKFVPSMGQVHDGAHELRYGRVSGKQVSFCAFHPGFHAEGPLSFTREQIDKSHTDDAFPDSYSLHLGMLSGVPTTMHGQHRRPSGIASPVVLAVTKKTPLSRIRTIRSRGRSLSHRQNDEDVEGAPDRFEQIPSSGDSQSFLDEGIKTDWSIKLVRAREALAEVIERECPEPQVFSREDLVYDFAPDDRDMRRVYFITKGCVVHRRRDPNRIINNGESCDGIFLGAGECYGVVPFLFGSSFENTDTVLRAWSNAVEVRYLELEDEETHPKDHSVLFKGLSELESAMVMRAVTIQVLRDEQTVSGITAVANLRRVQKTNQNKERHTHRRSAIMIETMAKCNIPSSHELRYFAECRTRTSKGLFISGYVLIFQYHFAFRPVLKGARDVLLDLRELSRVHSNGSMLQVVSNHINNTNSSGDASSRASSSAARGRNKGDVKRSFWGDLGYGMQLGSWGTNGSNDFVEPVKETSLFSRSHIANIAPRNLGVGSGSSKGGCGVSFRMVSEGLREKPTSIEFYCKSISCCREMRSAIQSVADEIKESRRLRIMSSTLDLDQGPFGPDPRLHPEKFAATNMTNEDSILARLHELCVDKMFFPGEVIVSRGDTGRDIYYIISGGVRGEMEGKLVEKLNAGDVIGERGFFSAGNSGCRMTAIAQMETECLIITPDVVKMLEEHEPKHAARFYRGLATAVAVRLYHALANVYAHGKT